MVAKLTEAGLTVPAALAAGGRGQGAGAIGQHQPTVFWAFVLLSGRL